MSVSFIIKNVDGKGRGLFSNIDFQKNDVIFRIDGANIEKNNVKDFSGITATNYIQIGSELYLECENHLGFFINHSCLPNTYIKIAVNKAFVLAAYPIKAGQELTFDYSCTSNETTDTWSMKCNCNNYVCRKVITGFSSVPDNIKKEYIDAGMVPDYIAKK